MRFERIRVEAFGRLGTLDTGEEALPGLVVVRGPNEAGKSTLFNLLSSLLYGFYPASRERHDYAPWDGRDASGSALIRLEAGDRVEVERRLLSSPWARLRRDGTEEDLRNRSLPWVEHVPRRVFDQLFALTLTELAGLDEETWAKVQDRLMGAMGATDLRAAREVAGELEEEAGSLWRPTRRGNQRIRDLQAEIRELRGRRRDAAERDAELRRTLRTRDEAREALETARRSREEERVAVERVQSLAPVRARLRRIEELRQEAGAPEPLEGIPAEPAAALREAEERVGTLERRLGELEDEAAEPRETADAVDPAQEALLERRDEVAGFVARASSWASDRGRLATLRQELGETERRLEAAAGEVLATSWEEAPRGPLLALSVPALRERVRRAVRTREELRAREAAVHERERLDVGGPDPVLLTTGVAVAAVGAVLAAVGLVAGPAWVAAGGAAALVAGVVIALRARKVAASGGGEAEDPELARCRSAEEEARDGVAELLRDLPVAAPRLHEPDEALASGLERLQERARDHQERSGLLRELEERVAAADREAADLARALEREHTLEAEALARLLEDELRRAERAAAEARAAAREVARIDREAERLREEARAARATADALRARLEELGDGDARRGAEEAERRLRASARADQLLDELERAHPDLAELRSRIERAEAAGEEWTSDPDDLARRRARIDALTDEIEARTAEAERLDQELRRMRDEETVDAVDGEIATLEEEEGRLLERRDRLWILATLVREADRRFREEHQPDVLRRAGAHLSALTGGRYDRIVADDGAGEHRFHLAGPGHPGLVPLAPPLSTGTLEQAWLALRLAIVDHLDDGQERLPLFVDEVLVNWDEERRSRGLEALVALARTRQVFFFTCHDPVADRLEAMGGRGVRLGPA